MPESERLLLGEFRRSLDERYRLSIPGELMDQLGIAQSGMESSESEEAEFTLAKERPGCLSLWLAEVWKPKLAAGIDLVRSKVRAGKLQEQLGEVQLLGRLLSTRHKEVQIAGRGRLLVPEGFREFLRVEPGGGRDGGGRRRVHRDLAARRLGRVSRPPHAPFPQTVRQVVRLADGTFQLRHRTTDSLTRHLPGM